MIATAAFIRAAVFDGINRPFSVATSSNLITCVIISSSSHSGFRVPGRRPQERKSGSRKSASRKSGSRNWLLEKKKEDDGKLIRAASIDVKLLMGIKSSCSVAAWADSLLLISPPLPRLPSVPPTSSSHQFPRPFRSCDGNSIQSRAEIKIE